MKLGKTVSSFLRFPSGKIHSVHRQIVDDAFSALLFGKYVQDFLVEEDFLSYHDKFYTLTTEHEERFDTIIGYISL